MAGEVLTCILFDAATGVCAESAWLPQASLLPTLTVSDSVVLAGLIVFNWAYAYGWSQLVKFVRR